MNKTIYRNLFPECNQIRDSNEIRDTNLVELYECCLLNCDKQNKLCKTNLGENQKCDILYKKLCGDYCKLVSNDFQIGSPFFQCTEKANCNTENTYPSKKCIMENINSIQDCFNKKCNLKNTECSEYFNLMTTNNPHISLEIQEEINKQKLKRKNIFRIIFFSLIIVFSIVIVLYTIIKLKDIFL